jgi:hypothetical protein
VRICPICNRPLSLVARIFGHRSCRKCRVQALARFTALLTAIAHGGGKAELARPQLEKLSVDGEIPARVQSKIRWDLFASIAEEALTQSVFTQSREEQLLRSGDDLIGHSPDFPDGGDLRSQLDTVLTEHPDLSDLVMKWIIARANAGRLEAIDSPQILLKAGERAHLQMPAEILEETSVRQYSGFSVRIAKGLYYHVGQSQPLKSVKTVDHGLLTVTSKRVVYTGAQRSVEILYSKLLGVSPYTDGIEFNVSNRKHPPLFKVRKGFGQVVAATVMAAVRIGS